LEHFPASLLLLATRMTAYDAHQRQPENDKTMNMKLNLLSKRLSLAVAAGLAASVVSGHAQDVIVTGSLTDVAAGGGVYDYTLTLHNTGTEALQALWLGWTVGNFDIANPSNPSSTLGWSASLSGNSIQFGPGTPLASGGTTMFAFDSTSTPAQFMAGTAGPSVAYGVDASFSEGFPIENTSLHSDEFTPTLTASPEPSTFGLLAVGSLGLWRRLSRKSRG
jgi:hypothetical protein